MKQLYLNGELLVFEDSPYEGEVIEKSGDNIIGKINGKVVFRFEGVSDNIQVFEDGKQVAFDKSAEDRLMELEKQLGVE